MWKWSNMPIAAAKELIRKLRSHGVKVYLGPAGEVTFSKGFSAVAPDLRLAVVQHGYTIRGLLREEAVRRAARAPSTDNVEESFSDEL